MTQQAIGGMDEVVPARRWPRLVAGSLAAAALLAVLALGRSSGASPEIVDRRRTTVAMVARGDFRDAIALRGLVVPAATVLLDVVQGGRVEALFASEGEHLEAGQPVLRLSNADLQMRVMAREAEVSQQLTNLRNSHLAIERDRLELERQLLDIDYRLEQLGRRLADRERLLAEGILARDDYLDTARELEHAEALRAVTERRLALDETIRGAQIEQLEESVEQLQSNLQLARQSLDGLLVRAPIDGQLTTLDAQLGATLTPGARVGRIDGAEGFKVSAEVDEFYVSRVRRGLTACYHDGVRDHPLTVDKVYPQIRDGVFLVDQVFDGATPSLRPGQTVQLELAFSGDHQALMLPRGGFFEQTGGHWIFVVSGDRAERRQVRLGRRNPSAYEVLEGLEAGERVIVSSYRGFESAERLVLSDR